MWSDRESADYFGEPQEEDKDQGPPCVTGTPDILWLNYGDIELDCTHSECATHGDVTWCEDSVLQSDVRYVRADLVLAAMPANWEDDPDTHTLARALGLTPNV